MRNRYLLLCDIPLFALSAYAAFSLRFDWFFPRYRPEFPVFLALVVLGKPIVFFLLGMYSRVWRYASVSDLLAVAIATSASSVMVSVAIAAGMMSGYVVEFSRAVLVIDWLVTICLTGGLRMAVRLASEAELRPGRSLPSAPKRVLVVGAGEAGAMVVREIRRNPQLRMEPVAFLDDDFAKRGKHVRGVPVVGPLELLPTVVERRGISEVIIAMPMAPGHVVRTVDKTCREFGIPSRILPGVFELLGGSVSVSRLRQIEITDLLRREQVEAHPGITEYLAGRRLLVTGAGGSIGSELCRQIAVANPSRLVLVGHGENSIFDAEALLREHFPGLKVEATIVDIRDRRRLINCFRRFRPEIVFHAAAHKHVPLMEENPEEAVTNNVLGTNNIIDACLDVAVERLVMISTDKAVSPTNMMGASKRVAEILVRERARVAGRAFSVVRFGNVLGSRGSVVLTFKRQIERGGPITITHPDVKRYFMTIPEAVHLVLQAGGLAAGGELFVLNMGEPIPIVQLAEDMIRLSGADEVPIIFTGLRPGEKLTEHLWEDRAVVEPTTHPEVLRVRESDGLDGGSVRDLLDDLLSAAESGDRLQIEAAFARWIPSYVPSSVEKHLSY